MPSMKAEYKTWNGAFYSLEKVLNDREAAGWDSEHVVILGLNEVFVVFVRYGEAQS